MQKLIEVLQSQLQMNTKKNLLFKDLESIIEVDQQFIEAILHSREAFLESQIRALAHETARRLIRRVYQVNQFIHISSAAQSELERIYSSTWEHLTKRRSKRHYIERIIRHFRSGLKNSITNHMQYIIHHEKGRIQEYLDKYQEILDSLLPQGTFYYAPQVQCAEGLIDNNKFRIERYQINANFTSCRVRRMRDITSRWS